MTGYAPFHRYCPEIGYTEYRSVDIRGDRDLPDGEYGFMELYCTERKCDCRRVIFYVVEPRYPGKILATIGYGWESPEFYVKWMHGDSIAEGMAGVSTAMLGPQSSLAEALARACEDLLVSDPQYVERLKRHYALFRKVVDAKGGKGGSVSAGPGTPKRKKLRWKH
ncbi:MAG: hypothetical protein FJ291_25075 [Planctomycetes bacterium]|nr:hypothetical protein [Planctomycetota bacterium]